MRPGNYNIDSFVVDQIGRSYANTPAPVMKRHIQTPITKSQNDVSGRKVRIRDLGTASRMIARSSVTKAAICVKKPKRNCIPKMISIIPVDHKSQRGGRLS